jgi:hypothetical protein
MGGGARRSPRTSPTTLSVKPNAASLAHKGLTLTDEAARSERAFR